MSLGAIGGVLGNLLAEDTVGQSNAPMRFAPRGPTALALDAAAFAPGDTLPAGTQWRFVFDMRTCIGCHACEVACGEQNGLPPEIAWRRVGEIETGGFPSTRRFHLSMACNHCIEPTCLTGCPANAYVKHADGPLRGIVQHLDDECIGCQYCTWTCAYEAPVFQPDRRIVTKCDMCAPRLLAGGGPACAAACPTDAIRIEPVVVDEWVRASESGSGSADAPGLAPSRFSVSTTRIELPSALTGTDQGEARFGDAAQNVSGHTHAPLVVLTVASQIAVGASIAAVARPSTTTLVAIAVVASTGLMASTAHLGRPIHALRALRNVRRSWLSREALLLGLYGLGAVSAAVASTLGVDVPRLLLALVAVLGAAGVYSSARLYMLPGRPTWDSPFTVALFACTAAIGPALADARLMPIAGVVGSVVSDACRTRQRRGDQHRALVLARAAALRRTTLRPLVLQRRSCAVASLAMFAVGAVGSMPPAVVRVLLVAALVTAVAGEVLARVVFMRTGLAIRMAGTFTGRATR